MDALIIEDNKNMARVLRTWLEAMKFDVTVTDSMTLAADIISSTPELEVITLDLNLKDSLADETIPRIAEIRDKNPDALLLVLSGVLTPKDTAIAMNLGADACIEKQEVVSEKTFTQKLRDVVLSLIRTPREYRKRIPLIEALAARVAKRCNDLGCSIGETTGEAKT
jgi:CheY-like chemotaxis protein